MEAALPTRLRLTETSRNTTVQKTPPQRCHAPFGVRRSYKTSAPAGQASLRLASRQGALCPEIFEPREKSAGIFPSFGKAARGAIIARLFMELLRDILLGVRSQPWRTALAFVAIVLGSLALGVMTAVLGGLATKSAQMLREFGGQVIVLAPAENASAGPAALTEQTAAVLAQNFPEALVAAARRYVALTRSGAGPPH